MQMENLKFASLDVEVNDLGYAWIYAHSIVSAPLIKSL